MKLTKLTLAITASLSAFAFSGANAAGLERSTQSVDFLFEDGNYAEVAHIQSSPELSGKDVMGNKVGDMLDDYGITSAAVKIAPTQNTAIALTYSQPWGVDTTYPTGNMFNNALGATEAHVETDAIGLIVGGSPNNSNFTIYGGVEYQTVSGYVNAAKPLGVESATQAILTQAGVTVEQYNQLVAGKQAGVLNASQEAQLAGLNGALTQNLPSVASTPTYYSLEFEDDSTLVPMVGFAYEKPEIALRAAVTYRAPAEYNLSGTEIISTPAGAQPTVPGKTNVVFPQSVSVDFQTGLSKKHQLLGKVNARWINWSNFDVSPPLSTTNTGEPLASYTDDQYSIEVGLGKKLTPQLSAEINAGYDTGTGDDLSLLGPYGAVTNIGLGAKYDVTDQLSVSAGGQYLMLEGGEVKRGDNTVLTVEDSTGYALGMKLGYNF